MTIRRTLDSDVNQITQFAIQGVNAFIAAYLEDEPTPAPVRLAVGPAVGATARRRTVGKPVVRIGRRKR